MASDASVEELIVQIDCAEGQEAQGAVRAMLHDGGAELAQKLANALPSLRGHEASIACWALGTIGPEARVALPALEEIARRRSALVLRATEASAAERAIVAIRADDPQFVVEALASLKSDVRMGAVDAIASGRVELTDAQAQSVAAGLAGMLDGRDWGTTAAVTGALRAMGRRAEPALPRVIELATAADPPTDSAGITRLVHVQSLGALGRAGLEMGPVLAGLLTDPNEFVRIAAMAWLRRVGPQSNLALAPLLGALAFESPPIGMAGSGFNDWPEAQRQSALASAEESRQAHQAEVRAVAAWALGELGAPNTRALSALAQATHSTVAHVRYHAITALGRIGHASDEVASALTQALADDRAAHVRRAAARALGLTADSEPEAVTTLAAALGDVETRKSAAWALGRRAEAAFEAVPTLIEAFDGEERRRMVIVRALLAIGPDVMHDLKQGLHRDDRWQRIGCAEAVGAFGSEARAPEPTLRELLFDRRRDVQEAAQEALEAISDNSREHAGAEKPAGG